MGGLLGSGLVADAVELVREEPFDEFQNVINSSGGRSLHNDKIRINMKETIAGLVLIRQYLRRCKPRRVEVRWLTDNTAAEAWIRRGVSGHIQLDKLIADMWTSLDAAECTLVALGVEGDNQAGDQPSRGNELCPRRVALCWKRGSLRLGRQGEAPAVDNED